MNKVLILGANGQLGRSFIDYLEGYEIIPLTSRELDITCYPEVDKVIKKYNPYAVINCASLNNVDDIEFNSYKEATKINTLAVGNLSTICEIEKIKFFTFSTDYVYNEEMKEDPLNLYGRSKLLGEKLCGSTSTVVRVSWLFSEYRDAKFNFVNKITELLQKGIALKVCGDEIGKMTYCKDVVLFVQQLLSMHSESKKLYEFTNKYVCSRYEVAKYIAEKINKTNLVSITTLKEYNKGKEESIAKRPSICILDCTDAWDIFKPQSWEEAIDEYFTKSYSS